MHRKRRGVRTSLEKKKKGEKANLLDENANTYFIQCVLYLTHLKEEKKNPHTTTFLVLIFNTNHNKVNT